MRGLVVQPFTDEHLGRAAGLLADRQRRHRAAEPLVPDALDYPAEIAALLEQEDAFGLVGMRDGRVVAYLIGTRLSDEHWGANAWVELAGHAAEDPEEIRDLYAAAAERWVADGRPAHYVQVPASEQGLVEAWFRLGFGLQHALAIREVPETAAAEPRPGVVVREAHADEPAAAASLGPLLTRHQALSPVFSRPRKIDLDEEREEWRKDVADAQVALLVAELEGHPVGVFCGVPVEYSSTHTGLARVPGSCLLSFAATLPEARGSGAGVALTDGIFAWARDQGYETIATDWRTTNLLASRFWPRRGFRPTFLRLHRLIS